jgi:tRNA modification GTPase
MREGLQKIVSDEETIVAISTALGRSGIGVIRVSGRDCESVARRFFKPHSQNSGLQHRKVVVGTWNDVHACEIDEVIVTFFQAPHSYTGEDVIEISAHGNPLGLRRIVESTLLAGARLAAPGEFTLRAVAHGKMDLVQAEAVRDFIESQTEQQAKIARRQMDGSLSKRIRPIKEKLIDAIAHLEAGIDFAEDDVDVPANATIIDSIRPLRLELVALKETFVFGKILATGLRLVILGKPNVGKSSLFNRLVAADRAIVTDIPGTTRDVVTETISLDGVPMSFADTAGVRQTTDVVESIGVTRTFEVVSEADLALLVVDGASPFDDDDRQALHRASRIPHIVVINKSDLPQVIDLSVLNGATRVMVSAKTGRGLQELHSALRTFLASHRTNFADDLILTNTRQHEAVSNAWVALGRAEQALTTGVPHEMVLMDLYDALAALDELTGEVVTDDILGRIFSTFCVGK